VEIVAAARLRSELQGYCVPVVSFDLDCADVGSNFHVKGSNLHGFDGDGDRVACET
jgi:hypothetical protein